MARDTHIIGRMSELAGDNVTLSLIGPWRLSASVTYQVHGSLGRTWGNLENLECVGPGSEMGTRGASWNCREQPVTGPASLRQIQSLQTQLLQGLAPPRPRPPLAHSLGARLAANPWCPVRSLCSMTLAPGPHPLGSSVLAAPNRPECTATTEKVIKRQSRLGVWLCTRKQLWSVMSQFLLTSQKFLFSHGFVRCSGSRVSNP